MIKFLTGLIIGHFYTAWLMKRVVKDVVHHWENEIKDVAINEYESKKKQRVV